MECDVQRAGGIIGMLQVLTLVAILSSTQLCSPPKGQPLDWAIVSSGLHTIRQEIQAGLDKQYKTRAG